MINNNDLITLKDLKEAHLTHFIAIIEKKHQKQIKKFKETYPKIFKEIEKKLFLNLMQGDTLTVQTRNAKKNAEQIMLTYLEQKGLKKTDISKESWNEGIQETLQTMLDCWTD